MLDVARRGSPFLCPVCGAGSPQYVANAGPAVSIVRCDECTAESARIDSPVGPTSSGGVDHFRTIDQEKYERSVRSTRETSYDSLLAHVERFTGKGRRWLDVGCSFGWLLERLESRGFEAFGVEPSAGAASSARERGLKVSHGTYPEEVGEGAPYDVVSFMDVLEHLPDPEQALTDVRQALRPDGLVVVQVPDQSCMLYWLARALARWSRGRLDFALQRMWLVGLDFPHLVYFTRTSLTNLFTRCGFDIVDMYRAPISQPGQAHDRVTYLSGGGPSSRLVSTTVGIVTALDALTGHGGLLVAIARPCHQTRSTRHEPLRSDRGSEQRVRSEG